MTFNILLIDYLYIILLNKILKNKNIQLCHIFKYILFLFLIFSMWNFIINICNILFNK